MQLCLSSAAAPRASLDELLAACARRGLAALELRDGDAHGVADQGESVSGAEVRRRADQAGVALAGFRSEYAGRDGALARIAKGAGAPVLVAGAGGLDARRARARALAAADCDVIVVLDGAVTSADVERVIADGLDVAWDVDIEAGRLGAMARAILGAAGPALRSIRLPGGGPEAAMHDGRGIGELMTLLALAGYSGPLILAPSSERYRVAWQAWLGRRGGWGCGSKAEQPALLTFQANALATGDGS